MANPVGTYHRATVAESCAECDTETVDFVMYDDGGALCFACAPAKDVSN